MLQGPLAALLLQTDILEMVSHGTVFTYAVLGILACFSILSLTIALSKWSAFNAANRSDARFVRAFRKSNSLETAVAAAENFRPTPLVKIFDAGYAEASRQLNSQAPSQIKKRSRGVCRLASASNCLVLNII